MAKKNETYFIVHNWMVEIGLSGNELNVFALIYSFSKDGDFKVMSRSYIASRVGITETGTKKIIDSLVRNGYIEREKDFVGNIMVMKYRAYPKTKLPRNKVTPYPVTKLPPTPKQNYPNNKDNNNIIINSSTTNACAHDSLDDEIKGMRSDMIWLEPICMNHKIMLSELDSLFDAFKLECQCNAVKGHPDMTEAKKHFNNWIRKYLDRKRYATNRRNNPLDNIERAQQQAIAESMELIRKAKERDSQI